MNVLESIALPHRLFQLCNLSQLELEKKTWSAVRSRILEIYTFIVVLLSIAILLHGIFLPNLKDKPSSDISDTVDFLQLIGIRLAHIACVIEALVRRNEQRKLVEKIQEIDRIFEISLNIDVGNCKFRSKNIKYGIAMLSLYICSELFILTITVVGSNLDIMVYWVLYMVPLLVCGVRYYQYLLFIVIIKNRFKKLIVVLGNVNLRNGNSKLEKQKLSAKIPATVKLMKNLDTYHKNLHRDGLDMTNLLFIRDLYNRLWELTILVNKCFGLSILVTVGVDFLAITSNFYWIFLNFKSYSSSYLEILLISSSAVWSVPHLFNILTLALICHKTVESTSEIALGVHRIQIDLLNDNHNSLIEQFSLQLLHQKIYFTAFGFFTIDCSLLYTIVGATTTYLIILIQFHMSEQKEMSARATPAVVVNFEE